MAHTREVNSDYEIIRIIDLEVAREEATELGGLCTRLYPTAVRWAVSDIIRVADYRKLHSYI